MKKLLLLLLVLALLGGAASAYWRQATSTAVSYRTLQVKRGDLMVTIGATGTVQPEDVVDVGAQVAGKIESLGTDPGGTGKTVDYGTIVTQGTILAHIDDSLYSADVDTARALVEQAKANLRRAEADLEQTRARLRQAERNWNRARELGSSRALSATEYDAYEAAYDTSVASVAVSEAAVLQARTGIAQAEATLRRASTNLGYCTIRSPVDGVIIDRRVNVGQTVVASLNAPSLFLIAKDLKKIQVWASVNEADIGNIRMGQGVRFTVDAYPGDVFRGTVRKVRLNATMTQNVVTYTVEIDTDNSHGRLLPYLTANVHFEVTRRENVLMAPNAALRWSPMPEQVAPEFRDQLADSSRPRAGAERAAGASTRPAGGSRKKGMVWVQEGRHLRPVAVGIGLSDGTMTEIQSDQLDDDSELVIGESRQSDESRTTNPFAPAIFRRR